MAGGGGGGAGARAPSDKGRAPTTATIQSTIQSIKEVVGGHSDADIFDALRESNMDPNETAQKLLNQDPFHEVKRKRDKKKENAGHKTLAGNTTQGEQNSRWMKPHAQRIENDQTRTPNQSQMSGPSREFRVVRDNRFQHGVMRNRPDLGHGGLPNVQMTDRSAAYVPSGRNRSPATTSEDQIKHQIAKHESNSDSQGTTQKNAKPYSKNSQNEPQIPTSEPAHGPSNARAGAGTAGPRRQVGVVNSTRQFAGRSGSHIQRAGASGRQAAFIPRNTQQNQRPDTGFRGRSAGRPFVAQNVNRYHQGSISSPKAMQPTKEWKPKSTKKLSTSGADNGATDSVSPSASNTENANAPDVNSLSDKISQANLHEVEHVIIPEHLRVPEYEQTKLRFGSFVSGSDGDQVLTSTSADSEQPEQLGEPFPIL